jgi:hypothetical protein
MKFKWSWRGFYFMGESRKRDQIIKFKHSFSQDFTDRTSKTRRFEIALSIVICYNRYQHISWFICNWHSQCCFFKTSVLLSVYYKELKACRKERRSLSMEMKFCWYLIVFSFYFLRCHLSSLETLITHLLSVIFRVAMFVSLINTYVYVEVLICLYLRYVMYDDESL